MRLEQTSTSYEEFYGFVPQPRYYPNLGTLSDHEQSFRSQIGKHFRWDVRSLFLPAEETVTNHAARPSPDLDVLCEPLAPLISDMNQILHRSLARFWPPIAQTVTRDPIHPSAAAEFPCELGSALPSAGLSFPELDTRPREEGCPALGPEEEFELAVRMKPIQTRPLTLRMVSRIVASPTPILDPLED